SGPRRRSDRIRRLGQSDHGEKSADDSNDHPDRRTMPERERGGKLASPRPAPEDDLVNDPFLRNVRDAIAAGSMLRDRDSVLVAVSGGPDSVALLAALAALGRSRWRIAAGHVNHRLRGRRSNEDQRFVERVGRRLGVPVLVGDGGIAPGANLEERARERRYEFLHDLARAHRLRRIATGHTLDDQAETVLLRLLRGAGGGGLSAIAPVRGDGVLRPLLGCTRKEVIAFLRRRRLPFRSDESNRSRRFTRNRIRRRVVPLLEREVNPAARRALARAADLLRDDEELLARTARRALRRILRDADLDVAALRRLPAALQRRVIRLWLGARRGNLLRIGADHVDAIRALAAGGGSAVSIPGGTVGRTGERLSWGRRRREAGGTVAIPIASGRWIEAGEWRIRCRRARGGVRETAPGRWRAVFDPQALDGSRLRVRSAAPGDRVRPLGLGGSKKLQDVFVDRKVPKEERAGWPVVEVGSTIVWLPGLVRSDLGALGDRRGEVVVIEARRARRDRSVAAE
ncbi:MAG: tRNA lysidine(34) synthetase TilS, partial [Candidatus Binatia bacterium]